MYSATFNKTNVIWNSLPSTFAENENAERVLFDLDTTELEQAGRKFSDVLSTSKIPKSAFFTLNVDNRKTGSCFELTEENAMCKPLLIKQETDYQLIERFSSGYVTLS